MFRESMYFMILFDHTKIKAYNYNNLVIKMYFSLTAENPFVTSLELAWWLQFPQEHLRYFPFQERVPFLKTDWTQATRSKLHVQENDTEKRKKQINIKEMYTFQ